MMPPVSDLSELQVLVLQHWLWARVHSQGNPTTRVRRVLRNAQRRAVKIFREEHARRG